jgi:7-cyano-7-deazaguanine synthase in queuosine biosynthesis
MSSAKSAPKSPKSQKCVVLISGGVTSLALLDECAKKYGTIVPVYVQSGFRWEEAELFWLKKFLRYRKQETIEPLQFVYLPLKDVYMTHWSNTGLKAPSAKDLYHSILLPERESLLLTRAALSASAFDAQVMAAGYLKPRGPLERNADLMRQVEELYDKTLARPVSIVAPFIDKTRDEIVYGMREVGYDFSFSCLAPRGYQHCGDCYKCQERKISFFKTGITDKTHYFKPLTSLAAASSS